MNKNPNFIKIFIIIICIVFVVDIGVIYYATKVSNIDQEVYDALDIAALVLSFSGFAISFFFSLAVYIQAKNQSEINQKLPQKDDQYITLNYALINFEKEITMLKPKENLNNQSTINKIDENQEKYQLVFLISDYMNKPVYKVYCKSIRLINNVDEIQYESTNRYDCHYAENILNRGYNCLTITFSENHEILKKYFNDDSQIQLVVEIESIFNVVFEVKFDIYLDQHKDISNNPDLKLYRDMETILIHHVIYQIKNKSIKKIE
ncbi:MAG: hypothetical protein WCR19_05555 [Acholeplasmataceae bacterium]